MRKIEPPSDALLMWLFVIIMILGALVVSVAGIGLVFNVFSGGPCR